jgi:hypothetical protein
MEKCDSAESFRTMYYKSKAINFLNVQSTPKSKGQQVVEIEIKRQEAEIPCSDRYNTELFTKISPVIIILLLKIFQYEFCKKPVIQRHL